MQCPKCAKDFEQVSFNGVELSRCKGCLGLWFDELIKNDLVKMDGAEIIDIGADHVDQNFNSMRDVDCPNCHQRMIPMIDKDQFHIEYEACPSCYGLFFDAGEFADLKEHTVVERFQKMINTLRYRLQGG